MKRIGLLMMGLVLNMSAFSQDVSFEWATNNGGSSGDQANAIAADGLNSYVVGDYTGTVDMDPGIGVSNVTGFGSIDVFIQKLDDQGNLIWVKGIGSISQDDALDVAADNAGNVFITGYFTNSMDFDPGAGNNTLSSNGSEDIFILKLDSAGDFVWVKQLGGSAPDIARSIALDDQGNVYVSGYFRNTVDFDPGAGTFNVTSSSGKDGFILKLNNQGDFSWVATISGSGDIEAFDLDVSNDNSFIACTGYFSNSADFDPGSGTSTLVAAGNYDAFVEKIDSTGILVWARQLSGTAFENGNEVVIDRNDNILTTGYFEGSVNFDPLGTNIHTVQGSRDVFVHKMDSSGNLVWINTMGGPNQDLGLSLSVDEWGNVYATGHFQGVVDFDPGTGVDSYTSNGGNDIFIQKLSEDGTYLWTKQIGGTLDDQGRSITLDSENNILSAGLFKDAVDFDPDAGVSMASSGGSNKDIYAHKMSRCQQVVIESPAACFEYTWIDGITYTSSNNTAVFEIIHDDDCDTTYQLDLTIFTVDTSVTYNVPTLTANATGASYQWVDCNNNYASISGETSQSFTATSSGSYAVIVSQNNCTDTSACYTLANVGLNEMEALSQFKVYPNPFQNEITIVSKDVKAMTVRVSDISGRTIHNEVLAGSKEYKLPMYDLTKGVYWIRIQTENSAEIIKLIKQ